MAVRFGSTAPSAWPVTAPGRWCPTCAVMGDRTVRIRLATLMLRGRPMCRPWRRFWDSGGAPCSDTRYGGFLALEFALTWPDLVSHLVLVATSARPVHAPTSPFESDAALRDHFLGVWPQFFVGKDKHWPLFDTLTFSAAAHNAAFGRELLSYDVRNRVGGLHMPVLLIVGSADHYRPAMEWLAARLPESRLHVVEAVGPLPVSRSAHRLPPGRGDVSRAQDQPWGSLTPCLGTTLTAGARESGRGLSGVAMRLRRRDRLPPLRRADHAQATVLNGRGRRRPVALWRAALSGPSCTD